MLGEKGRSVRQVEVNAKEMKLHSLQDLIDDVQRGEQSNNLMKENIVLSNKSRNIL